LSARIFAGEYRKWWTLVAIAFGLFMIMLDNTVVNVALPSIKRDLRISIVELEWIAAAYALVFASLLITGGKLADMLGRRRVFIAGLFVFTLSSLACGLASTAGFLIGARAVQGVGAALMTPASLSILAATFPARQRGTAIGIWAGVTALAQAIGPLAGGLIVENINWNWIFFVNVPVGAAGIVASLAFITESRDTSDEQSIDLPGLITSGVGLFAMAYALIEGNEYGWRSPEIVGLFAAALVLLSVFVAIEARRRLPMLDLSLFKIGTFTGANVVALLVSLAMFGVFFYVSVYLQSVLGFTPTQAGATFLPMTLLIIVVAPFAGRISDRVGSRWLMGGGMTLLGISLLFYQRAGVHSNFWTLLPAMVIGGVGMASTISPMTSAAMGAVEVDKAGVGSGVLNTFRQLGGALGIAATGAILAAYLNAAPASAVGKQQYVNGLHAALLVNAGIAFAGAIGAILLVRTRAAIDPYLPNAELRRDRAGAAEVGDGA
jgi:EmrB/QacA subfamily drug resistance transporter